MLMRNKANAFNENFSRFYDEYFCDLNEDKIIFVTENEELLKSLIMIGAKIIPTRFKSKKHKKTEIIQTYKLSRP